MFGRYPSRPARDLIIIVVAVIAVVVDIGVNQQDGIDQKPQDTYETEHGKRSVCG